MTFLRERTQLAKDMALADVTGQWGGWLREGLSLTLLFANQQPLRGSIPDQWPTGLSEALPQPSSVTNSSQCPR